MADKEKYMIKVEGKLVEVTPEVYYAYFRMERQERGQEEKKAYNKVMSYDVLDDEEKKAIDNIPDVAITSMDEIVIANDMKNRLHRAMDLLSKGEWELSFEGEPNSALLTTILEKIVVKKESTKEEIHLDVYLKLG